MSDAARIIQDIVFEHAWVSNTDRLASYGKCECGHETAQDCDWYPYDMGNHARHVADTVLAVLSETHAVVELPEVTEQSNWAIDYTDHHGLTVAESTALTLLAVVRSVRRAEHLLGCGLAHDHDGECTPEAAR